MPPWSDEEIEKFKKMRQQGLPYKEIAPLLRRTAGALKMQAFRMGNTLPNRRASPKDKDMLSAPKVPGMKTAATKRQREVPSWPIQAAKTLRPVFEEETALARVWTTREESECAWPVDGEGADTRSCCHPTVQGKAYCAGHAKAMYEDIPFTPKLSTFTGGLKR
jgi:GcrA cell cycle regulator